MGYKHARALRERAYWVNQVWNYCNDLSFKVLRREHRFLSGFDFAPYLKGLGDEGVPLHSQTVQAIAEEYATRRKPTPLSVRAVGGEAALKPRAQSEREKSVHNSPLLIDGPYRNQTPDLRGPDFWPSAYTS